MESGSGNQTETVERRPVGDTDLGRSEINRGGTSFLILAVRLLQFLHANVWGLRQTIRSRKPLLVRK